MTDAELLLGLSRHLHAYTMTTEKAALDQLSFAGQVFDLAFRLRGSTSSPASRVAAIGLEAGLGGMALRPVLQTMEALDWVSVQRGPSGEPRTVLETIPPPAQLVREADRLLSTLMVSDVQLAVLAILRATTLQPLVRLDALAAASSVASDKDAATALRYLGALVLAKTVRTDDGREVVYNPNVWTQGSVVADAALRAADAHGTGEVRALLEELATRPGLPEARVTSTESKWINFAVAQGLVQRSVIQTSDGVEQGFLFTPHLGRDPFGGTAGDASGQVRQLVGSMIYATTFARYRLTQPEAFLRSLISNGVAGDASPVGTDYPMLEKAGIVRVVPGSSEGKFRLELLQSEVAEDALGLMSVREGSAGGGHDAAALRAQRSYIHIEQERARLAVTADSDQVEEARLLAALREVTTSRSLRPRG